MNTDFFLVLGVFVFLCLSFMNNRLIGCIYQV